MDEELKAMLEGAKAQGASDTDLGSIIDMYEADASKKKASSNWGSDSQPKDTATSLVSGDWTKSKTTSEKPVAGKVKLQKPPVKEESSFFDDVVSTVKSKINKLATGSAQLGADYASTPELLYDAFAMPQNAIADYFDIPSLRADSEKFKKNVGVKNAVKEYYQGEVVKLREHAKQVDAQYQDGIYDSFKNGDILGGFDQLTNSFSESLPATASIMMGGAFAKSAQLLATSSMVFGAGKNEQLKDENPDIKTNTRVINALATGLAEGAFETIGSGSIGAAARGIIEREGAKKGAIILKDGLTNIYKATIAKNPLLASMGVEGGTEWATKVTQNSIDVATGVKPQDFNVFEGATDALISGIFGGAVFGAGLKGLENVANSKDKSTIKSNVDKTFELQKALENPDIPETTKAEIEKGIDGLVKKNQELIKKNVDHVDNLHPKVKEKLVEAVTKIDEAKDAVKAIKLDGNTNDAQKQILLDGLKEDFKKQNALKSDILDGKTTPVDVLPLKEQDKIKRQALKELTAEQNPDGTTNVEIDNAQIVERANKLYKAKEELEVQPQVEDVVAEVSPVPSVSKEEGVSKVVEDDVKPIGELGNGSNIYFETEKYRVNDRQNGKVVLNIGDENDIIPIANVEFDSAKEAVEVAKKLSEYRPNGLTKDYNIEGVIETLKNEVKDAGKENGNIVANGNVRIDPANVGENGITEQESVVQESVPSSVDGGEVKGDVEVGKDFNEDDIANFLNAEFGAKKPVETPKAEVVKPKKEVAPKQEKVAQAKGFVSLAVNKLTTSLKDFQGRAKEYSQQTYDRIVNEAKEGKLNISSIPPIQIWNNPDTGKFVILAGHSRTKAFADLADGKVAFSDKYKKSDFTNVNAQIVEAETLEEAQKIAKESNQGAVQTVVDNAKYVRESLLPTFSNKNQAKTKLRALYGASWARIYAYANLNPKGKAMQMLKQFENANEGTSDDSSKRIAEWTGKARSDFEQLTDAHENEIFGHLLKNDKVKTYEEFSQLLNNRVNGLEQFDANEPLNFESKVGRGSNEVEVLKEIQDFKNREAEIKKSIKKLQANGKQITDSQRQEIKNLTAEAIKINTVDIPNAQKKQKQAKEADANQFDIFSHINEQIENGNITPEQVDEFVNDDRKAAEIEPIVEAIEIKAKSDKKAELEEVVAEVNNALQGEVDNFDFGKLFDGSLDNNKNELTQSEIQVEKDKENEEMYQKSSFDKKWAKTYKEATEKLQTQIKDAEAVIEKWSAKVYKKGAGNKFVGGELEGKNVNLDRVNENRRDKAIKNAQQDIIQAKKDLKELGVSDVEAEVVDNENVPTAYHENFKKEFPNTLLAIEEQNGLITIFEDGKSREIEGHKFFEELKKAIEKGYKGIGKVTRKAVETESKKLLSNAKIDKVAAIIKKATKADINPDDYHNNGFAGNQDKLIDLIADAAKKLVSAKIDLDEAIRQVIESIKAKFGDIDIDVEAVKQKINPKAEEKKAGNDFKAEPGVSSVLKRLRDGGNDASTNAIIDEVGLNYKQRSQAQVYADGVNFVKDVGIAEAYNAVKNSEVKHSDTINVVYATILQQFPKFAEAEIAKVTDPDELNALVKELDAFHQKIYTEFASRNTDAGQGISMINYIINQDQKIRYSLAQQIKKFQSVNNGVVPPEVLEKMKELEKRYSEANDKIEQLEGLLKDAQEQKDFDNIVDEEKRNGDYKYTQEDFDKELQKSLDNIKKDVAKEKKATPKEYAKKAKVVADTFRKLKTKSFDFVDSDGNVVKIHTDGISWNDAIEFGAKAIEKSGQIADGVAAAIAKIKGNDWYKNLSDKDKSRFKKELENHYNESETANEKSASTKIGKLSVSEEGKISIPNSLIRSLVKDGYDNINKLTAKILEDYKDEFPDLTERDIRDAITKYGKTLEPDNVDPAPLIRKIKRAGKAISAIEDIAKGIRPKRSGLQRDKLDTEERKILRDIKEAMENLPKDPADLSKHLKTSLDAIKTRLNNHIEDLEKQIANKEKFKAEKKSVELDQDAKDLVTKRDGLKAVLEELVNVPKTEDEIYQEKIGIKLKQREKVLADLIAGKKKDVNGANSDWSAEISKVNTEINRLREKQKPVKAEKTEDEKYEADVENKIKSLVKRIDDMKANNPKSNDGKSTVWNNEISELETELKNLKDSKKVVNEPKVTVDKTGKVRIPTEMIKDFISKGGTDLSEFATQVQQSIKDEFPDVTVREIRESVANYGKKANKSRTQITADIQRLKSEEKLRLEYEDLQVRISKEKNQIRKQKLSQTAKRLKEQIKQLQDDLGITETERTNRSVNYTKKRIEILRDKIKNNDFAKKEIKPIAESQELKEARIEKNRVQEEFDYLSYKQELENRTFGDKAGQLAGDLYDSQRLTLATGEVSFVGAQGSLYMVDATFSRKTLRNLVENFKGTTATDWKVSPIRTALKMIKSARSAEAIIKMVNTMGTANNYMDSQRLIKELPDYDIYVKMGIRILGEDVKTQVKDDNFYGNKLLNVLRIPIHLADRVEKKNLLNFKLTLAEESKKRTTIQGYYEKLTTGKVSDKNKKTATEIFDNANPLATFERGNSTFMNFARIDLADTYIAELRAMGKNPIDHIDDFKKLGSAINTITGSGNLNQTVSMALPILNKLMFSARYFAASWNILSPMSLYYLAKLGNYDGMEWNKPSTWKTWKPTVAQKAFVKPVLKGLVAMYGISLLHVAMINAAIDDDDEMTEEEKAKKRAYIEYDSKSSNFMQVNSGNTHTSYFGPYRGNVIFMSKILSGQTKNKKGEIIENGSEFGSRSDFQIGAEYLAGKANPTLGVLLRYMQGAKKEVVNEETGQKENKRMLFNDDVSFGYQLKHNTYPIFAKTVIAVLKEDPVLGAAVYNLLAFTGINTNVYEQKPQDTPEQKLKESQDKIKNYNNLPEIEKIKVDANNRLPRLRGKLTAEEKKKSAIENNTPYYEKGSAEPIELNIEDINDAIESIKEKIERTKKEAGSRYKPPKEE